MPRVKKKRALTTKEKEIEHTFEVVEGSSVKERFIVKISKRDFRLLKLRAEIEGLTPQLLISSVIHKYVVGKLVDLKSVTFVLERLLKKSR